jgi:hypothetical protein
LLKTYFPRVNCNPEIEKCPNYKNNNNISQWTRFSCISRQYYKCVLRKTKKNPTLFHFQIAAWCSIYTKLFLLSGRWSKWTNYIPTRTTCYWEAPFLLHVYGDAFYARHILINDHMLYGIVVLSTPYLIYEVVRSTKFTYH